MSSNPLNEKLLVAGSNWEFPRKDKAKEIIITIDGIDGDTIRYYISGNAFYYKTKEEFLKLFIPKQEQYHV